MFTYPANEEQISEIERGLRCEAVVSLPPGASLLIGETILFALSSARPGQQPSYVKEGDSVLVSLTAVTDLGAIDPDTGRALVRIAWKPLGSFVPPVAARKRAANSRRS